MKMNRMKRAVSLLLSLLLLLSSVPVNAFAAEEITAETAAATEPIQATAVPTQPATEPEQATSAPTEAVTEPAAEETVAPTQSAVPEETSAPTEPAPTETLPVNSELLAEGDTVASGTCGENLTWTLDSTGKLTISGSGEMTSCPWRPSYTEQIKTVVIEDGVTSIGYWAFMDCSGLTSVDLPDSLTSIAGEVFKGCSSLTSIDLPDSLTRIGYNAFKDCTGLTSIVIPDGVTIIESEMFRGCTRLANIDLPEGLVSIESGAFYSCKSLTSIDIPDSVVSIGETAFASSGLTSIVIPNGVRNLKEYMFQLCTRLSSVTLPDGLLNIGNNVFDNCTALKEITIPRNMRNIGAEAFFECVSLYKITFTGNAPSIGENAFKKVKAGAYYPMNNSTWTEEVLQNYGGTLKWVSYDAGPAVPDEDPGEETVIESGKCGASLTWTLTNQGKLTISGSGTMYNYFWQDMDMPWAEHHNTISSLVIENGVTSIGEYAFYQFTNLPDVVIPDSVTRIGGWAFDGCDLLLTATIGRGVQQIGSSAFQKCYNLADVYIYDPSAWCKIQFGGLYSNPMAIPSFNQQLHILDASGNEVTDVVLDNSVTTIPDCAFIRSDLTSIVIPNSVTKIGEAAFSDCASLTSIIIPDGVTSIEYRTFDRCDSLTSVAIPDSVTDIKEEAFYGCDNLKSIVLPEGLLTIGENAFEECALTELVIPDTVTSIDRLAFGGCNSLESVIFGYSVQQIGDSAFFRCQALKTIKFRGDAPEMNNTRVDGYEPPFYLVKAKAYYPEGNATWTKEKRVNYGGTLTWVPYTPEYTVASGTCGENLTWKLDSLGKLTISGSGDMYSYTSQTGTPWYSNCEQIKSVEIANGVTGIGAYAFAYCPMESVVIPASVTSIGKRAFYWCNSLADAYILDANAWCKVQFGDSYANPMYRMSSGEYRGSMHILDAAGNNVTELTLNDTVTEIPNNAFRRCDVTKVVIPDSVTAVGAGAFSECPKLESVTLGDNVTSIGNNAFNDCGNLKSINIPSSVTSIGSGAFAYCGNLTSNITIPYGVTRIEAGTFADCFKIKVINVPDSVTFIGEDAFNGCNSLQEVNIPDGVTTIGQTTFRYCDNLKKINIPNSVTTIGWGAFSGCESLTSVVIPDSVTEIYSNAFSHCYGLESVVLPKNLTAISNSLFSSCDLKSIIIPEYVTSIGDMAFYGCDLTDVAIPAGVTAIGEEAFRNCRKLKEVVFKGNAPVIGEDAFCYVKATMYYAVDDPTWTEDIRQNYGGTLTWVAICTHRNTEILPAVDPTCTESGLTEGSRCISCQEIVVPRQTIPALGHDMAPWEISKEVTCTEHGEERRDCSRCDCFETQLIVMPGHTEVTDEGFPATCTENGLTDGKHCAVCSEVLLAQEEIPAAGHAYATENGRAQCSSCGKTLEIRFTQEHVTLDLQKPDPVQLGLEISPADLIETACWSIEGDEGIISIDRSGLVTPLSVGTVYVAVTVDDMISARCRVDVTEALQLDGVQLSTNKLTAELYSTDYAGFEVLLQLPQNNTLTAAGIDVQEQHKGIAIEKAVFTDDATAQLFDILVLDDRSLQVIPKDDAVNNPAAVAGKYTSAVTVTVLGKEYVSENLTLTVKKTLPKLKATVAAFNSFCSGDSQKIAVSGATITAVREDPSKPGAIPDWLDLSEDGTLTLNAQAPLKSTSAKAYLLVDTEEWRIPAAVTLAVKNTYKARGLKLSASSVTFTTASENSDGVKLNLLSTGKNVTLADLKVTGITAPDGYIVENFNMADGSFILKTETGFKAGTVNLGVTFEDTVVTQPLKLTVKTAKITLKAVSAKVTLNISRQDSAVIDLIATPADYRITDPVITLTGTAMVNGKKATVDKLNSGELEVSFEDGKIKVATTAKTPDKASYKLSVSAGGSKAVTVTVNTVSADPSVTFKAAGAMDLSFPNQTTTITPAFKNCGNGFASFEYTVTEMKGKTVVRENVTKAFCVEREGTVLKVRCADEDIDISHTYLIKLKLIQEDGNSVENTVTLKVKRTAVKLKLSASKLSLNKLVGDQATVAVSCTTKGYDFTEPVIEVNDSWNNNAAEQLDIRYSNGKLTVGVNEVTAYGETYKISVRANRYAPAAVLTVSIPAAEKSGVAVSLKAGGKLDVIRDGSAITLTPSYKNCIAGTNGKEEILIYSSADNFAKPLEDRDELFEIASNGKGGYTVTRAEGAKLDHSLKYKAQLVMTFGEKRFESKLTSMSVTMGSAKLTAKTEDGTLFAKDGNDRAEFCITSADKLVNGAVRAELKDAKQQAVFEILDYGNGKFAIAFKDGTVEKSIIGKTVTVNLNVYLEGNETAKPNTTVKLKLTVVA